MAAKSWKIPVNKCGGKEGMWKKVTMSLVSLKFDIFICLYPTTIEESKTPTQTETHDGVREERK